MTPATRVNRTAQLTAAHVACALLAVGSMPEALTPCARWAHASRHRQQLGAICTHDGRLPLSSVTRCTTRGKKRSTCDASPPSLAVADLQNQVLQASRCLSWLCCVRRPVETTPQLPCCAPAPQHVGQGSQPASPGCSSEGATSQSRVPPGCEACAAHGPSRIAG